MSHQATGVELPEFVRTIMDRAVALFKEGRFQGAEVLLATVADQPAVKPLVLHLRGLVALHLGQKDRAQEFLTSAIDANPADSEAHANLGLLLLETHRYPQAAGAYAAALSLDPRNATWHFGLAKALAALGLADLAIDSYRDACARAPDYTDAQLDLGLLSSDCGDIGPALVILRDASRRQPDRADLHMALAFSLFAAGDWPAAWTEYEWRRPDPRVDATPPPVDRPRWEGADPAGKTILVTCEQGYGDALQFVRYVPMLEAKGASVVLQAPPRLVELLRSLAGIDVLVSTEDPLPAFDFHLPLLSLPGLFGTRIETIPPSVPYLTADAASVEAWRKRLGAYSGMSIGLCWQGNPAHVRDRFRSMHLDALRPLLECPGARFFSLQIGPGQDQFEEFEGRIIEPASLASAESFADTAGLVANLDLVICVDTAIAHLAGALGKPVWIMLAAHADWRWLRERDDTPWYPQARLFRQSTLGDWDEVVARVRDALWSRAGALPARGSSTEPQSRERKVDPALCDALFVEGVRHYNEGDLQRSTRLFERVLAFDRDHVDTLCNLASLKLRTGDPHRALELAERAFAHAPDLLPARLALAETSLACGATEEAKQLYRKAIEFAPKNVAVRAAFAMALEAMGDHEQAMQHFEQTVKIDQRQPPEFYEALGRSSSALGNLQGAEICFRHAIALNPNRATAHSGLGRVQLALGQRVDAAASFHRALDIAPHCDIAIRGLEQAQIDGSKAGSIPVSRG